MDHNQIREYLSSIPECDKKKVLEECGVRGRFPEGSTGCCAAPMYSEYGVVSIYSCVDCNSDICESCTKEETRKNDMYGKRDIYSGAFLSTERKVYVCVACDTKNKRNQEEFMEPFRKTTTYTNDKGEKIVVGDMCYQTYPCQHKVRVADGPWEMISGHKIHYMFHDHKIPDNEISDHFLQYKDWSSRQINK